MNSKDRTLGVLSAGLSYVMWGVLPVYWKALQSIPPIMILAQRIFWSFTEGLLAILLLGVGGLEALQAGTVNLGLPVCLLSICVIFCLVRKLDNERPVPAKTGEQTASARPLGE